MPSGIFFFFSFSKPVCNNANERGSTTSVTKKILLVSSFEYQTMIWYILQLKILLTFLFPQNFPLLSEICFLSFWKVCPYSNNGQFKISTKGEMEERIWKALYNYDTITHSFSSLSIINSSCLFTPFKNLKNWDNQVYIALYHNELYHIIFPSSAC